MERNREIRATPQLILGLIAVFLGVLFTLDNLDLVRAGDYLRFWPVLPLLYGAVMLSQATAAPGRIAGILIILVSGLLLLDNLNLIRFRLSDYWPLILVGIGTSLVIQAVRSAAAPTRDVNSFISVFAFWSGIERSCNTSDFRGGDVTAIMGGCEIDLRPAAMQVDEAVLQTFAFWGGIEIRVPEDWTVVCKGFPFMGGFEERTQAPREGPRKVLRIRGLAVMGGIEIKN